MPVNPKIAAMEATVAGKQYVPDYLLTPEYLQENPTGVVPPAATTGAYEQPPVNNTGVASQTINLGAPSSYYTDQYNSTYGNIQSTNQLTVPISPVTDPYTSALMARGMSQGELYNIISPEARQAEEARRLGTLSEYANAAAGAQLSEGLTAVERQMIRAGKLSSSATTQGMMRESSAAANTARAITAQGALSIYEQLDATQQAELNRILQGSTARLEAETAREGIGSQERIANLNASVDREIAAIQADVTLTGYEKEAAIAELQARTQTQVAALNAQTQKDIAAQSDATNRFIANLNYDAATKSIAQEYYQTDVQDKQFWADLKERGLSREQQLTLAYDRLRWEQEYGEASLSQNAEQFWANLNWAKNEFGMTQAQQRDLFMKQLSQDSKEFDLTRADQREQFTAQMNLAKTELGLTAQDRTEMRQIARDQLAASVREFDLTQVSQREMFNESMEWDKEQFGDNLEFQRYALARNLEQQIADRTLNASQFEAQLDWARDSQIIDGAIKRGLQQDYINENARQFNIQSNQWAASFNESIRQFNLDSEQRATALLGYTKDDGTYVKGALEIQQQQLAGTQTGMFLETVTTLMKDPAVLPYLKNAEGGEALLEFIMGEVLSATASIGQGEAFDTVAFSQKVEEFVSGGLQNETMTFSQLLERNLPRPDNKSTMTVDGIKYDWDSTSRKWVERGTQQNISG